MRILCFALLLSSTALADAPIEAAPPKEIKLKEIPVPGTKPAPVEALVLPRAGSAKRDVNAASDQHLNDSLRH